MQKKKMQVPSDLEEGTFVEVTKISFNEEKNFLEITFQKENSFSEVKYFLTNPEEIFNSFPHEKAVRIYAWKMEQLIKFICEFTKKEQKEVTDFITKNSWSKETLLVLFSTKEKVKGRLKVVYRTDLVEIKDTSIGSTSRASLKELFSPFVRVGSYPFFYNQDSKEKFTYKEKDFTDYQLKFI